MLGMFGRRGFTVKQYCVGLINLIMENKKDNTVWIKPKRLLELHSCDKIRIKSAGGYSIITSEDFFKNNGNDAGQINKSFYALLDGGNIDISKKQ